MRRTGIGVWAVLVFSVLLLACGGGGGGGTVSTGGSPGSYALSVSPGALNGSVPASGTATVSTTVAVVPANGFAGTVTFSVEGLPAGVTAAFSPAASDTSATLQLTIAAGAAQGSTRLAVKGRAAGTSDSSASLDLALYTSDKLPVLTAVEDQLRELQAQGTTTPAGLATAIAAFMRGRPEYVAAGVDPADPESAWGELQNGRLHLVVTSQIPLKTTTATARPRAAEPLAAWSQAARSGSGIPAAAATTAANAIPGSGYARLMHSFGPNFQGQEPIDDMAAWLKDAGWKIRPGAEGDASLDLLKTIGGDGFFYINSHGGIASKSSSGLQYYCLSSSTVATSRLDEVYKTDLDNDRVVYLTGRNGDPFLIWWDDWSTWYGITCKFVEQYWSFAPDSVVWINACFSQASGNCVPTFRFTCQQKGAGTYVGWTSTLSAGTAYSSVRYFVDRCLGANRYQAEYPAQRPFPTDLVLADMNTEGLTQGGNGETLLLTPRTSTTPPALLAPSIRLVEVDEYSYDMKLKGSFGSDAGEVSVGGSPVTVRSWGAEEILCTLPSSLSGDILVKVRGIKSNPRPLTQWTVPFTYTWAMAEDFFNWTASGTLRYRLDVSGFRTKPGEAPTYLRRGTWPVAGGALTVTLATGNLGSCAISATTVTMPTLPCDQSPTAFILAPLIVDASARTGLLGFAFAADPSPWRMSCPGQDRPTQLLPRTFETTGTFYQNQEEGAVADVSPVPAVDVTFGSRMELVGGTYTNATAGAMKLDWQNASQSSPPRPADAGI